MEEVYYHGSSTAGIKTLEPRRSTHGNYVYATNDKSLAIIFAQRCGGNLIYSLFRNGKDEPWSLVERVPRAILARVQENNS